LVIEITAGEGDSSCDVEEAISVDTFEYSYLDETSELKNAVDRILRRSGTSEDFKYNIELFGTKYQLVAEDVDMSGEDKDAKYAELVGTDLILRRTNSDAYVIRGDEIQLEAFGYPGYTLKVVRISENVGSDTGRITVALLNDGVEVDQATIDEGTNGDVLYDDDNDMSIDILVDEVSYDASTIEYFGKISFTSGETQEGEFLDEYDIWKIETLELDGDYSSPELLIEISAYAPGEDEDDWECIFDEDKMLYMGETLNMLGYLELGFTELSTPSTGQVEFSYSPTKGEFYVTVASNVKIVIDEKTYTDKRLTFYENGTLKTLPGEDTVPDFDLVDGAELYIDKDEDKRYTLTFNETGEKELTLTEPTLGGESVLVIDNFADDAGWSNTYMTYDGVALKAGAKTDFGTEVTTYSASSMKAVVNIVDDAVRYQVYAGKSVTSSGNELTVGVGEQAVAGKVIRVGASPLPVGLAILDSDLSSADAVKNDHYIVVGGPCANSAAAALLGVGGDNCADGFTPGEAMIRLFTNGNKYQLLVAGAEGKDTLLATKVLGSYATYADDFEGKTEVKVKGTKLSDVEITS